MSYRIEFTPATARAFKKLPQSVQSRMAPKVDALASIPRPHGVEKLAGHENRYRIRVGEYRIIYIIDDGPRLLTIAAIGHRREVYR